MNAPRPGFFDRPEVIRGIQIALAVACAAVLLLDLLPLHLRHPHLEVEKLPGFYALFGFCAYVGIVTVAKGLRRVVSRPEDYYDER